MIMEIERSLLATLPTGLYIDGRWRDSSTGSRFAVDDPATAEELTTVADASPDDARAALDAAVAAQESWAATPPRVRGELLRKAYEAVIARVDDFALLMTLEMGKALPEARGEVAYGAEFLRWFSEEAVRIDGRYTTAPDGASRLLVLKKPVGPCLLITPWNFPLAMATRKIAPALAAGCTTVVKPAALTPLTTLLFAQILDEVGVPAGVVNVVPTSGAGAATGPLIADPRLRKLSFTGSTEVGRKLLEQASTNVLRTSMELGGNAPFIVFEDADLDAAIEGAVAAKLRNVGEACTAANRFYVHEDVADEFAQRLAARFEAKRVGRGTEDGVDLGPLIDEAGRDKVTALVDDAVRRGATVVTGGAALPGAGWFYRPTVLAGVPEDAEILSEEIFGPVAPITTFRSEDEAVALANGTDFGLISYVYTRDAARMLRIPERLESGMLGINSGVISNPAAPFGGVKQSGLGREGGHEGIDEYLETMYVGIGGL
ncbi:succinate-semialdehyde dehydrogenase/glutarate-semialdehyde dehydrogenase [Rhodococcus sp. SMB37]|uniref:NAD-dependent succinate-semialdehyde dehydrogenase n=1 Tax=Rhodococcus sp. SMB37 TaxID=2512213 RepID=UPI0006D07463|nr:NAD-dependent succinate-semialdehyde dehydrogenase [Rhodococcus sp. SMB37]TCN49731.1 succinate-semialdehyde dehydrogenase/glutarate-semialdehyde dehydrogenase [Rhodococcus sp. SMB37]